jgi:hypothetical protein
MRIVLTMLEYIGRDRACVDDYLAIRRSCLAYSTSTE